MDPTEYISPLFAARIQMGFTLGWHIIVACLGVGLPVLLLFAEYRYLRTGKEGWKTLAQRWSKGFAVLFAIGAVSGTVLSFELGLLWPEFMGTFGAVIGFLFTLEGFAFFLEAIFVGIYLYTWDRLPPRVHWLSGFPIAISGCASAFFVVIANAWMNAPQGFTMTDGVVTAVEPLQVMFNPAMGAQTTHMIVAAYMVSGFLVASYYAALRLKGLKNDYTRRAMGAGIALGAVFAPVQAAIGDWAAKVVADTQPVKFAAMEGQFQTQAGAPLRIGGIADEESRTTKYAIEIPGMLSWIAYGDMKAEVTGLDAFPREDQPPVAIVHGAFQVMVGLGSALAALGAWVGLTALWRKRLPQGRLFLSAVAASGPAATVAMIAGWVVTEVGRQPWIVQGVMRTSEAVTEAPGIHWVVAATVVVYAILTVGAVTVLAHLARQPLPEENRHGS